MAAPGTTTAHVAARLREVRQAAGYSCAKLADAMQERGINWNRTTVTKIETGRRESVSVDELEAIASTFRVPIASLLTSSCSHCFDNPPRGFSCNRCEAIG